MTPEDFQRLQLYDRIANGLGNFGAKALAVGNPWMTVPRGPHASGLANDALERQKMVGGQQDQQRKQQQQVAASQLFGGTDPRTGITWNQGRPGQLQQIAANPATPPEARRASMMGLGQVPSLLAQASPDKAVEAMIAQTWPNPAASKDRREGNINYLMPDRTLRTVDIYDKEKNQRARADGGKAVPVSVQATTLGGLTPTETFSPIPERAPVTGDPTKTAGLPGGLRNLGNQILGAFNMEPGTPEAQAGGVALKSLMNRTNMLLAEDATGRPSNYVRERIQDLEASPFSIFQGEPLMREKLQELRGELVFRYNANGRLVEASTKAGTADDKTARAQANQPAIRRMIEQYDVILEKFGVGSSDGESSEAIRKRLGLEPLGNR